MARPISKPRSPVSEALIKLREHLGDSQQDFANRTHLAVATIARYETSRPPRGQEVIEFFRLANKEGLEDCAAVFRNAMIAGPAYFRLAGLDVSVAPTVEADLRLLLQTSALDDNARQIIQRAADRLAPLTAIAKNPHAATEEKEAME